MLDALVWLLAIELLGLVALPLAFFLFNRLPDRGYTLAKPLALVLFPFVLWILGLTHLIPNSRFTIIGILVLGTAVSAWVLNHYRDQVAAFVRAEWRTLLVAEGVFLAFLLLWLGIASGSPAITHTEKLMDFGFVNAVLQSRFFPPEDPWLAGHSISYYYFGHFIMAFLIKLTGITPGVGYNLAVTLVPALVAMGAFGLLYNLVRLSGAGRAAALVFGLAAPALIILIGNLESGLEFVHAQGWGSSGFWSWVGIDGLEGGAARTADGVWKWVGGVGGGAAGSSGAFPDDYLWWWNATRVINTFADGQSLDYTITEFPFFSFILGDLHAHVMSLPFMILVLSLGLNLFLSPAKLGIKWLVRHPLEAGALALFLGSLAFINAWDFPLMVAILLALVLAKSYGQEEGNLQLALRNTALLLGPVVLLAVVLFLPFYWTLAGQAPLVLPLEDHSTRPFLFFIVIGLLFLLGLSFLLRQLTGLSRPDPRQWPAASAAIIVPLAPFLVWAAIVLVSTAITDGPAQAVSRVGGRFLWVLPALAMVGLAGFSAAQRLLLGRDPLIAFPLLLLAVAMLILVGAELFYVVDVFGNRMNTVFKVYYQAWLLLALVGAYALYHWYRHRPGRGIARRLGHYTWIVVVVLLATASLYYSVGAGLDRAGLLRQGYSLEDNTLDGLAFLRGSNPGEYEAIQWLRDQAPWGRIVEAVGGEWSDYGRISAGTGLPTVLGWEGHERQWRGSSRPFDGRKEDVAQIYRSDEPMVALRLLQQYDVRYVYVGHRERASYGEAGLGKFDDFLRTAFTAQGVIVYEMADGAEQGRRIEDGDGSD